MAVIGVKSITGITSITNAAGGADVLTFHSNNTTERVRIQADGNVALGTNAVSAGDLATGTTIGLPKLHVDCGHLGNGAYHIARFRAGGDNDNNAAVLTLNHSNDRGLALYGGRSSGDRSWIALKSIDSSGRVSNAIEIIGDEGRGVQDLKFYTGDSTTTTERLSITSGGKIGINSTSPTYALEVDGGTQNTVIAVRSSDAKAAISFMDYTSGGYGRATIGGEGDSVYITSGSGNERIRFGTGGSNNSIGISTTANLVTGSEVLAVRGYSSFKSTNNNYAAIYTHNEGNTSGTYNAHILWNAGGANRGGIGYMPNNGEVIINNQNALLFATGGTQFNGTERLRIHADGEVEIKAAANGQTVLSCTGAYASGSTVDIQTWERSDGAVKAAIRYSHGANNFTVGTATNHVFGIRTNNSERIRISNSSAATSIGGVMSYNALLTTQGDVSGGLLMLKAAENTTRLFVSGSDTAGCEVNLYDNAGGQKGILAVSSTEFAIKAPNSSATLKFYTNDGSTYAERMRVNNSGGIDLRKTGCNRGLIWIHDGEGGDACQSMANVQGSGGRGLVSNKIFNIAASTTTDLAKSHWGGLCLIGWAGTGHQGHEQVMFGYNQTPSSRYKAQWQGNLTVTYTMSAYTLRISHNASNALNFWCILIGV